MLRIVTVVLAVLAAMIALALIGYSVWNRAPEISEEGLKMQSTARPETTPQPSASPGPGENLTLTTLPPTPSPDIQEKVVRREGVYTLLVVGRDRVGMNTDTIMAVQMDTKAGTVNAVSIPRDTLVNVPWAVKKANSIYGNLGIEGLVDGIEDLIGIPIDNYVVVNTYVFQQVIDAMGGVWFDVPMYMDYDDPDQDLHIHLYPGYQLLSGYQAEGLVRFRQNNNGTGYGQGDLQRIETQHAFFKAAAEQLLSLGNLGNLPSVVDLVLNNTDTNLTSGNMAYYAQEFFKMDSGAVRFYTMPYETVYIRNGSYVSIQLEPWLDMINAYLNPFNMDVTAYNLDVITYSDAGFFSTTGGIPSYDSFYNY